MMVSNSPNKPTGAHLSTKMQRDITPVAEEHDLIIFCDEVFYPLFRLQDEPPPPSFLDLGYEKAVVISSLGKAYILAGVRVGQIASIDKQITEKNAAMRHYTTISVSQLDEAIAAKALAERCCQPRLSRARSLAEANIHALEEFVHEHEECAWTKPFAGTTAMLLFTREGRPVDDREFCLRLLRRCGVLLCPVSVYFGDGASDDFKGYVRVGVAIDTAEMTGVLLEMREFMREDFRAVLLARS